MAAFDFFRRILRKVPASGDTPATAAPAGRAPLADRRRVARNDARAGLRILIIDDSATVVAVLGRMLRQNHFETAGASDAETGIAFAREERPDLIMISGNAHATEQFYVRRIGADDFMKKPFGRDEVFARIRQLVDAGRLPPRERPLSALPDTDDAELVVEADPSEPDASPSPDA